MAFQYRPDTLTTISSDYFEFGHQRGLTVSKTISAVYIYYYSEPSKSMTYLYFADEIISKLNYQVIVIVLFVVITLFLLYFIFICIRCCCRIRSGYNSQIIEDITKIAILSKRDRERRMSNLYKYNPTMVWDAAEEVSEKSCSICLLPYTQGVSIRKLIACSHIFHSHCIEHWIEIKIKEKVYCPICKLHIQDTEYVAKPT
jgi:hypothetical protein